MRKPALIACIATGLLCLWTSCFSQNLDLIVTHDGDSIACRIDSLTDSHIYYEMKIQNAWIHTHISRSEVGDYQQEIVDKKKYLFKPGTSIIASLQPTSLDDLPKNSVYAGIMTLSYARMVPVGRVGLTFGAGLFFVDGLGIYAESTVLIGKGRHFFEPGIMGIYFILADLTEEEDLDSGGNIGISFRAGYRYQGPQGLLLRTGINLVLLDGEIAPAPALSIGYSF